MCTCLKLLFIFISLFMTISKGRTICPFIETLSFGSDFLIQCNESYLIVNETNNDGLNWKFADQTSTCDQDGSQKASVNQCGVTRIGANYLKVPMKSLKNNEEACVYCRLKSKSIAPVIKATQSEADQYPMYIFNITATGLDKGESFEILWAKRVNEAFRHSYNYWFLPGCRDGGVKILINTSRTITFEVYDGTINRAEFIIRRCNGPCRKYDTCNPDQLDQQINSNSFQIPDSIEKISCDYKCLTGLHPTGLSPTNHRPQRASTTSSTTIKPSYNVEQIIKISVPVILIGISLTIFLIVFIRYIISKSNNKKHVYAKTSNIDPDEHK